MYMYMYMYVMYVVKSHESQYLIEKIKGLEGEEGQRGKGPGFVDEMERREIYFFHARENNISED